jgi:hypothetical protein
MAADISQHGPFDQLHFPVAILGQATTKRQADNLEYAMIDILDTVAPKGYNTIAGQPEHKRWVRAAVIAKRYKSRAGT